MDGVQMRQGVLLQDRSLTCLNYHIRDQSVPVPSTSPGE